MSPERWSEILDEVTRVSGVRGAVVVAADDGLVVHESAMDGMATSDLAALASAVVRAAERIHRPVDGGPVRLLTLAAEGGSLLAVQGAAGLWLVAVASPDAEIGRLRLLLGDVSEELA